jgi:hypothetical protein
MLQTSELDIEPDNLELCLRRLDAMMSNWNSKGITLGYPIPTAPEFSNLDQDSNIRDSAIEPVIDNLCVRIAPIFGKQASPDTKKSAKEGLSTIRTALILDRTKPMPIPSYMAKGAGHKAWRYGGQNGFNNPPKDFEKSSGVRLI